MCIRCISDECAQCKEHSTLKDVITKDLKHNNFTSSKCICDKDYLYNSTINKCGKNIN